MGKKKHQPTKEELHKKYEDEHPNVLINGHMDKHQYNLFIDGTFEWVHDKTVWESCDQRDIGDVYYYSGTWKMVDEKTYDLSCSSVRVVDDEGKSSTRECKDVKTLNLSDIYVAFKK